MLASIYENQLNRLRNKLGQMIKFKISLPRLIRKRYLIPQIMIQLSLGVWILNQKVLRDTNLNKLLVYIKEINIQTLDLEQDIQSIPQNLVLPVYSRLEKFYIRDDLYNMETIAFLNCQKLKLLQIQSCKAISLKALNKTNWRNLSQLSIQTLFRSQFSTNRIKLSKNNLFNIKVCFGQQYPDKNINGYDLNILCRLECQKVKQIRINNCLDDGFINTDMVQQYKTIQMLNCRFQNRVVYKNDQFQDQEI